MSHPKNRHERKVVGKNKSKKRVPDFLSKDDFDKESRRYRDTTKLCSCAMCGNKRKFFGEKTIQEKRNEC